jgi:copper homeostasis protein
MNKILEICCDTMQSVINAKKAGAQRIELCTALSTGGVTPTMSFVKEAVKASEIPINVLLRPRAGSFVYTDCEFDIMCNDIEELKKAGAAGIVSGALLADGRIDKEKTLKMIELSRPLGFTFHRGIDFCTDIDEAMEFLCDNGAERVLTSGGAAKINGGIDKIIEMHKIYGGRICIMPGGGLNTENANILNKAGITKFHFSASEFVVEEIKYSRRPDGLAHVFVDDTYGYNYSSVELIKAIMRVLEL